MTDTEIYNSYKKDKEKIDEVIHELPNSTKEVLGKEAERLEKEYTAESVISLKVGEKAPDFTLKNAVGNSINLYDILQKKKVILTFYRGTWCPYCQLQLTKFQEVTFKLKSIGSVVIAVSPQNPDESLNMKEKNSLEFEVLSDPGNQVATKYTSVIKKSDAYVKAIDGFGKSFSDHYSDDSNELPIPAVFIIDQDGTVLFAKSEGGNYAERVETSDIINALS